MVCWVQVLLEEDGGQNDVRERGSRTAGQEGNKTEELGASQGKKESFVLVSGFRRKDLLEEGKEEGCLK